MTPFLISLLGLIILVRIIQAGVRAKAAKQDDELFDKQTRLIAELEAKLKTLENK